MKKQGKMIDSNDDNRMAIAHDKPKENELNEAVPPHSWTSNKDQMMLYLSYVGDYIVVTDWFLGRAGAI